MFVTGISIDNRGTKLVEDGFFARKVNSSYELIYAVVDLASFFSNFSSLIENRNIASVLSKIGCKKSDFSFSKSFKNAFLFRLIVSGKGEVESFTPFHGKFSLKCSYTFDSVIEEQSYLVSRECLEKVVQRGAFQQIPKLASSMTTSIFVQSLNMFISGLLAEYLIKQHRVSAIVTGLRVHSFVVPSKFNVSEERGTLIKITPEYGALIDGCYASPVRLRYIRANYFLSDQIDMGDLAVSIGSPLRSVDALLNQIILYHHLDNVLEFNFAKGGDLKIIGPSIHDRVRYMESTTKQFSSDKVDSGGLFLTELSGKFLRDFVSFLIANNLCCAQLNSENLFRYCSFNDRVRLLAYFISVGVYPSFLTKWLQIRQRKSGRSLLHILSAVGLVFNGSECKLLKGNKVYYVESRGVTDKDFLNNILKLIGD